MMYFISSEGWTDKWTMQNALQFKNKKISNDKNVFRLKTPVIQTFLIDLPTT